MEDPALSPSADDLDPDFQIQQHLKGDRNQAIGQAIDSTIVNFAGDGQVINLTINDRIPTVGYCGAEPHPARVSSAASIAE